jgi:hypothetical protein
MFRRGDAGKMLRADDSPGHRIRDPRGRIPEDARAVAILKAINADMEQS